MTPEQQHAIESLNLHLDSITCYFLPVEVQREFSYGKWPRRYQAVIECAAGGKYGYGEICLPQRPGVPFNPQEFRQRFQPWLGCPLQDLLARTCTLRATAGWNVLEAMELTFYDLAGKLLGIPALDLLGLTDPQPVPQLHCILKHDPEAVAEQLRWFMEREKVTHLKMKLFGDLEGDARLIATARDIAGPQCYLAGDVNCGYKEQGEQLAAAMKTLAAAGLNGCEDPAKLTWENLKRLQQQVPELNIIPDELMRPAFKLAPIIQTAPGMICNLHPDCMGSITEAVNLGHVITRQGAHIMIGDDSLVGPACVPWQQLACALHANWVEAIEKPQESDGFLQCIRDTPMAVDDQGRKYIATPKPGFGLTIDREQLRQKAECVAS